MTVGRWRYPDGWRHPRIDRRYGKEMENVTTKTATTLASDALGDLIDIGFDIDLWAPGDDVDTDELVRSFVALAAAASEEGGR